MKVEKVNLPERTIQQDLACPRGLPLDPDYVKPAR